MSQNLEERPANNNTTSIKQELWEYLKMIIIVVVVVFLLTHFVIINAIVPSESMENTIMTGDQFFGARFTYWFEDPQRYDIVVFKYPDDESQLFVKRVIELTPGDKVEIIDGKVYINDSPEPLDDSFIPEPMKGSFGPYEVPENYYFMLGDNRNDSKDSRYWQNTYVSRDAILGKAGASLLAFKQFGF